MVSIEVGIRQTTNAWPTRHCWGCANAGIETPLDLEDDFDGMCESCSNALEAQHIANQEEIATKVRLYNEYLHSYRPSLIKRVWSWLTDWPTFEECGVCTERTCE